MIKKRLILIVAAIWVSITLFGQAILKDTRVYAQNDQQELKLDIYKSDSSTLLAQPCLVFVFGGGFKDGARDASFYLPYFEHFARKGFTVVSIDYTLGMKGEKAPGLLNFKPLQNAIALAVNDLYTATSWLLNHAEELHIDPSLIIISGSSAGAITVLQADYWNRGAHSAAGTLPDDFQYAGVISFAGGIFSTEGVPSYPIPPAPTLFFHGSSDKLVPYNKTRFLHLGMFGSKSLASKFKQERYPYLFYSMDGIGHEASEYPMHEFIEDIGRFIDDWVFDRARRMVDIRYEDMTRVPTGLSSPSDYYN